MKLYLQVQLHYAGMSGGFPLQVQFGNRVLRHHRVVALDNANMAIPVMAAAGGT